MLESYHSIVIIIILTGLYLVSYVSAKTGLIKMFNHKKIWNYLLILTFLGSGIIGLLLAIFVDQKISIAWYQKALWFHVEFGIGMALISIFHIIWHFNYFKNL